MKFLYPATRKYPVDRVCERIVRRLQARKWKGPGPIDVSFTDDGVYEHVDVIERSDFRLLFKRVQGSLPHGHSDSAAVHEIYIPEKQLVLCGPESGPVPTLKLYVYAGSNWEQDRDTFRSGWPKVHRKLWGHPRLYLTYTAPPAGADVSEPLDYTYLNCDDEGGTGYAPQGDEPRRYRTRQIMEEFADWLTTNVLEQI